MSQRLRRRNKQGMIKGDWDYEPKAQRRNKQGMIKGDWDYEPKAQTPKQTRDD